MKNRNKTGKNGSFYIALCGCAVVVALVSYVGGIMKNNKKYETEDIALKDFEEWENKIDFDDGVDDDISENTELDIIVTESEPEQTFFYEAEQTAADENPDEFLPIMPASGKVVAEFSGSRLVKYEKLGDWRAHSGIDIEAAEGDDAYACEDGVVEKIYSNNMGGCVLLDHGNGYKSLYASLGEIDLVNVGDELCCGETVGRIGTSAVGDLTSGAHLHFELYYEGVAQNPLELITVE